MESVQIWTALLGNFGFPMVLAGYLLLRFEKKIEILTEAISTFNDKCGQLISDTEKQKHL
ncbi:YvrJ family protein [Priestia megaterium]|uniref:YvrJ family protein n=1 Tax=Priestia megaterium TaxID=1404 RepID=UPI001C2462EA|nr:YvrJ family protein [Priestia megaterium]MBU8589491.1 YvrJ family protein [Priestia megaterium]